MPYTLEQNGVIEQKNRFLQECVGNMLKQAKLLNCFWAKAIGTIIYLQNRTLTKTIARKTPEEMWTCEKPYVAHLKVLGVKPMFMSQNKRNKSWIQSQKNKECIFIGYTEGAKRYKLLKEKTKIVFHSKDVVFDETLGEVQNEEKNIQFSGDVSKLEVNVISRRG